MRKAAEVSRGFSAAVHILIRIIIVKNKSEQFRRNETVRICLFWWSIGDSEPPFAVQCSEIFQNIYCKRCKLLAQFAGGHRFQYSRSKRKRALKHPFSFWWSKALNIRTESSDFGSFFTCHNYNCLENILNHIESNLPFQLNFLPTRVSNFYLLDKIF